MKNAYKAIAAVFFLFALVQYNDPDPLVWMPLYAAVAIFYLLAALGRWPAPMTRACWLFFAATLAFTGYRLPEFLDWLRLGAPSIVKTMKAETPYVELTREFLGALLAALAAGWLAWRQGRGTEP